MSGIQKLIKLDMIAIKPYLTVKNFLIVIALGSYYAFLSKNLIVIFSVTQLFAVLFSSYPFLIGDESGIDSLYKVFGLKEEDVVFGRYLSSALISILCLLMGMIIYSGLSLFMRVGEVSGDLAVIVPVIFAGTILLISFEYPFYFKYGYAKAKIIMTLVFLALGLFTAMSLYIKPIFNISSLEKNIIFWIILSAGILVFIIGASVSISLKWYKEKEIS